VESASIFCQLAALLSGFLEQGCSDHPQAPHCSRAFARTTRVARNGPVVGWNRQTRPTVLADPDFQTRRFARECHRSGTNGTNQCAIRRFVGYRIAHRFTPNEKVTPISKNRAPLSVLLLTRRLRSKGSAKSTTVVCRSRCHEGHHGQRKAATRQGPRPLQTTARTL